MTIEVLPTAEEKYIACEPIAGDATGKNLLSMCQLNESDIHDYIEEAYAAETLVKDPTRRGALVLPFAVMKAVMRQPSTRTGGSCTSAMQKLGGSADLISGMQSSSEAKDETPEDTWKAYAAQTDLLGIRSGENNEPELAATVIDEARQTGQLTRIVPVINLGDGTNEHPTQGLGDMFTIHKEFGSFEGLTTAVVGDLERYRAHHSFLLGATALGMNVVAVETKYSKVPKGIAEALGSRLQTTEDINAALKVADVLYIGRNPKEYKGKNRFEKKRSKQMLEAYSGWTITPERLSIMSPDSIVMHPRPRNAELPVSIDKNPRMRDVQQMDNMTAMRMAIFARHLGASIKEFV